MTFDTEGRLATSSPLSARLRADLFGKDNRISTLIRLHYQRSGKRRPRKVEAWPYFEHTFAFHAAGNDELQECAASSIPERIAPRSVQRDSSRCLAQAPNSREGLNKS
jgi:hypothetical protein